ncbi:MAG: glycosyltransferase family 4 protein [Gammaproteobacteria bacterium]|nr:glycosyltransferase family 4 protein [Gammaproteobacteria bacterium]
MTTSTSAGRRIVISTRSVRTHAGSSRIVLALVRGLATAGHEVEVIADRLDAPVVRAAGGQVYYPLGSAVLQRFARRLLSRERLRALRGRAVVRRQADLVIGEGDLERQDVVLLHNVVAREVEALGDLATAEQRAAARAQERVLAASAWRLLVTNSELTRGECLHRFGCAPDRVAVVHPGCDPRQFNGAARARLRDAARIELGVAPGEMLVAFVCSGHFRLRGIDILAGSLDRLPPAVRRGLRVLGVGHEDNTRLLGSALARHGLATGYIERPRSEAVERYYCAADLLFHPALFETFGLVCLEAAACGCPVLTSRAVGAAELFTGSGAQAVVLEPTAVAFAPLLGRFLTDASWRADVAASQCATAGAHDWDGYATRFVATLAAHGLL